MSRLTRQELDLIQNSRRTRESAHTLLPVLKGAWHRLVHGVRQSLLRRRVTQDLQRLSDHLLRDIGISREEIDSHVTQMAMAQAPASAPLPVSTRGPGWRTRLRQWHQRRATIQQLQALDARLLDDIGVQPGDIPAVAARLAAANTPAQQEGSYWDAVFHGLRRWDLSRQAAHQMARLDTDTPNDLGYVKGDVDWVPEALAERRPGKKAAA